VITKVADVSEVLIETPLRHVDHVRVAQGLVEHGNTRVDVPNLHVVVITYLLQTYLGQLIDLAGSEVSRCQ
jgi:hypothetical protein